MNTIKLLVYVVWQHFVRVENAFRIQHGFNAAHEGLALEIICI